jgi:hypothetical protein
LFFPQQLKALALLTSQQQALQSKERTRRGNEQFKFLALELHTPSVSLSLVSEKLRREFLGVVLEAPQLTAELEGDWLLAKAVCTGGRESSQAVCTGGRESSLEGFLRRVQVGFETGAVRVSERWTNKSTTPYLVSLTDANGGSGIERCLKLSVTLDKLASLNEAAVLSCSLNAGIFKWCAGCEQAVDLIRGLDELLPSTELFGALASVNSSSSSSSSNKWRFGDVAVLMDRVLVEFPAAAALELQRLQLNREGEKTEFKVSNVTVWDDTCSTERSVAVGHVAISTGDAALIAAQGKQDQEQIRMICVAADSAELYVHNLGVSLLRIADIATLLRNQLLLPSVRFLPPIATFEASMAPKPPTLLLLEATNNGVWLQSDTRPAGGKIRAVVGGGCVRYRSNRGEEELSCIVAPLSFCVDGVCLGSEAEPSNASSMLKSCNQLRLTCMNRNLDASTSVYDHIPSGAPDQCIRGGPWHVLSRVTVNSAMEQLANDIIGAWPR